MYRHTISIGDSFSMVIANGFGIAERRSFPEKSIIPVWLCHLWRNQNESRSFLFDGCKSNFTKYTGCTYRIIEASGTRENDFSFLKIYPSVCRRIICRIECSLSDTPWLLSIDGSYKMTLSVPSVFSPPTGQCQCCTAYLL